MHGGVTGKAGEGLPISIIVDKMGNNDKLRPPGGGNERTHQGKRCNGRTPMQMFLNGKRLAAEKNLGQAMTAT